MLTGTKTYILAGLLALAALVALLTGQMGVAVALQSVFGALSLGTVRAAVKKIEVVSLAIPPTYWSRLGGFLPGTKTYLTAVACAGCAVFATLTGDQSVFLTAAIVVAAVGVSTLRMALARVEERLSGVIGRK